MPLRPKAIAPKNPSVSQLQAGAKFMGVFMGVALPRRIQPAAPAPTSRNPSIHAVRPPRFSVHLPIRIPTMLVPSAIQMETKVETTTYIWLSAR